MNASRYIGRVGGLAVALGVGTAIITGQGIAVAIADGETSQDNSQTGDGSGGNTAKVNDNPTDDVGKIAVKPRHRATDTTPNSVTATSIVKRLRDAAEDAVKRVTDARQNAAGATTNGDKTTQLTTSRSGGSSALADRRAALADRRAARAERLAARTTLPDPSSTDGDADADTNNVVANQFVSKAPTIKDWLASPRAAAGRAADTAPPVPTQSSLWTPPRILNAPLFAMKAAPTASVSVKRPNLLAAVLGDVFKPFAGTAPNAPTPESPLSWMMLAAARRQLSGAAINLDPPSPITVSPTLIWNGNTITPAFPETVTGIYPMKGAGPGVKESIQGYQKFNVVDANGNPAGTFYGYVSTNPYLANPSEAPTSTQVIYVDSGIANLLGDSPVTGALPDGSVITVERGFNGAFVGVYSAIPSTTPGGAGTVTLTLTDTNTGRTIDLSRLIRYNAADLTPALPDYINGVGDPTVTAITGHPPTWIAVQGYQTFEYLGSDGSPVGNFNAVVTTTKDIFGFHTEALLVTGYPDTGQGDAAPPIGSVYNTINFLNLSNVYSSIPQDDGTGIITNILTNTSTGQTRDLSWLFQRNDASAGLTDPSGPAQAFSFGGYTISPAQDHPEVFTGVNGLPPMNASIQGEQLFDFTHGTDSGTFTAVVTTLPIGDHAQGLLVTSSSDPATVPVGSVFDVRTYPFGFVSTYASLVGAGANGQNLITQTLVTPWGVDIDLSRRVQGLDAAAGLNPADGFVSFANKPWLELFTNLL